MDALQNKYIKLMAEKFPTEQAVCREIINLNAILNLPKGTEHFMSDIHGEYEAFCHILNNCSGVVREKVEKVFGDRLSPDETQEICTLIYYPREKLQLIREANRNTHSWYRETLYQLIDVAKFLSSKYTRSKVRKAMTADFSYIIDELIHAQQDEDDNQIIYHEKIVDTIIDIDSADDFIIDLAGLIKRLAVDHLHIVGDIFDRGPSADKIIDMLMSYHSLDVEWGNHDILWMGTCCGNTTCIAYVVLSNIKGGNIDILEKGYGISLRELYMFAQKTYSEPDIAKSAYRAISVIMCKLEGRLIDNHSEYEMSHRKLLHKINKEKGTIQIDGKEYKLNNYDFPTVIKGKEYELSAEEKQIISRLKKAFTSSVRLNQHIEFLYKIGSMYRIYNGNLLYHGCVPLDSDGNLEGISFGGNILKGKSYLDYCDAVARRAYFGKNQDDVDFMWFLWCGKKSPLSGRNVKTFQRIFIDDETSWKEESNPYYKYYYKEKTCNMILRNFDLYGKMSHIINGHTPVRTNSGEEPVRAHGKLIVIDGGFCKNYHKTTGIAGYTLIYNSHGMRIKSHQPFESVNKVLTENKDIESSSETFETEVQRIKVKHTDTGKAIYTDIEDLKKLLSFYRNK